MTGVSVVSTRSGLTNCPGVKPKAVPVARSSAPLRGGGVLTSVVVLVDAAAVVATFVPAPLDETVEVNGGLVDAVELHDAPTSTTAMSATRTRIPTST